MLIRKHYPNFSKPRLSWEREGPSHFWNRYLVPDSRQSYVLSRASSVIILVLALLLSSSCAYGEDEINKERIMPPWLMRNYGPRCTLVCAASILQKLGARSPFLVEIIESITGFNQRKGPPAKAYLGKHCRLDRGIEHAAEEGGIKVKSRTRFFVRWHDLTFSLDQDIPVILNCFRAPGGHWKHSILAIDYRNKPRRLLILDPNDGQQRWLCWHRLSSGWLWICSATFVSLPNPAK